MDYEKIVANAKSYHYSSRSIFLLLLLILFVLFASGMRSLMSKCNKTFLKHQRDYQSKSKRFLLKFSHYSLIIHTYLISLVGALIIGFMIDSLFNPPMPLLIGAILSCSMEYPANQSMKQLDLIISTSNVDTCDKIIEIYFFGGFFICLIMSVGMYYLMRNWGNNKSDQRGELNILIERGTIAQ